jgi:tetratricopeptide (TPR) repeat protein
MKGPATATSGGNRPIRRKTVAVAASMIAALALAGCASLGSPSLSEKSDDAVYGPSESNLSSLSEVIQQHPSDPQAYNMRGSAYGAAGMNEQALADFNKAISLDPNYAQAYANRGLVYRHMNNLDPALADYNKALSIEPSYAAAYLGRGIIYNLQGKTMQSLADFNKAIALRPNNAEAYYNRGLLYQGQGQHQFAIDDFTTAIGLASQSQREEPYLARALSYLAGGNNSAAATDLDQAVQLNPSDPKAWTTRGLAYERLGQHDKSAGSYAKALNLDAKYAPAIAGFARVGGEVGKTYQTF